MCSEDRECMSRDDKHQVQRCGKNAEKQNITKKRKKIEEKSKSSIEKQ